jgi:hypothetical protein
MRQVVVGWALASSIVLAPLRAGAHSLLVEPPPRSQTVSTTSPCGAGPTPGTPARQYATGQMVQVSFQEVQSHGTFRLALSSDNVTFGTVLLDGIPAQSDGASRMVTVQMPSMACDPCVLQLYQRNGGSGYYSCADVRVVAAPSTTTTTTVSGSSTTTTTLLDDDGCDALEGFDEADCRIGEALGDEPCPGETVVPSLRSALRTGLLKVQRLVHLARLRTKPAQVARLLRKADRALARVETRSARMAFHGRNSGTCDGSIGGMVDDLRTLIGDLDPTG